MLHTLLKDRWLIFLKTVPNYRENCRHGHSMKAGFNLFLELRVEEIFTPSVVRFSVPNLSSSK